MSDILNMLGLEYVAGSNAYGYGGAKVLEAGDAFVLMAVDEDGTASVAFSGRYPDGLESRLNETAERIDFSFVLKCKPTGRTLAEDGESIEVA